MEKDLVYFPFGTRCNSASIINGVFHKRFISYPFDWIDINIKTMLKFISIEPDQIEPFFTEYFQNFNMATQKHNEDGTWFPHDFIAFQDKDIVKEITERYIRRFKRMHTLFESGQDILFFTIFPYVEDVEEDYFNIRNILKKRVKGESIFLTINFNYSDFEVANMINFYVQLSRDEDGWAKFDQEVVKKLTEHETTKQYFKL